MYILNDVESKKLRNKYIDTFVDTGSSYYIDKIKNIVMFHDGPCYTGYLWDCLNNPVCISESIATKLLCKKTNLYVMWDVHSSAMILIPNYWKYPKESVILCESWANNVFKELPEDIYFFDNSFSWSIIYTHETDRNGNRYCIILNSGTGDVGQTND